jgi:tetratricopeptide (TPR) repeat protein
MPDRGATIAAAKELHQRGLRFTNTGRPREARRELLRALKTLSAIEASQDSAHASVLVLKTLGYVEYELLGLAAAMARLDEAEALLARWELDSLRVGMHNQRAIVLLRTGRLTDAIAEFDAALADDRDAPVADRCSVLQNRAVANMELGAVRAARADLQRCLRDAESAGLELVRLHATHNLGYVEFVAGNLPLALELMDAAFRLDPTVAPGTALLGKAEVLGEAGLHSEADEVLSAAADIFQRDRVGHDLAEAELERARCALAAGEVAAARRFARSARDRFRRRSSASWRRSAELVLIQADLLAGVRTAALLRHAHGLRDELAAEGVRLPARQAALLAAQAALATGDEVAARRELDALGPARRDDPITGRMQWHYVSARVEAASGDPTAASRRVRRALDELARYQASFGSTDLRTASAVHGRRLAELDITLALQDGRVASVFNAAERARAVSSRLPPVRPPEDPAAADLLAELRQVLESLRAVEQDKAASEPLLCKRRELERQIVARSWTLSGSGAVTKPVSLERTRAALQECSTSMVTYVQAGAALSAVVVGDRVAVRDLGPTAAVLEYVQRVRADLDVLAHPTLPSGIRAAVRASLQRSLAALDTALITPLAIDGPLVLVATGALSRLPWASLPSLRGRSIVVAPSATKWLASSEVSGAAQAGVVALSGPDLGRGEHEVAAVGEAWPAARVQTGATAAALVDATASATVLHVAAHGVHQPENPLFSSVRMTDGPVFAHELDQRGHAPEHVVLSACEVGLATIRPGDEALGLASVLLNLGTCSVIAGVARVGDAVAEQTMAVYHAKLASGLDSAASLAAALAEVDADVVPPFVTFGAAWTPDLAGTGPLT